MAVLCAALLGAVIAFFLCFRGGLMLVDHFYLSDEAVSNRLAQNIGSFRNYVAAEGINSTDVNAIGLWNRDHQNIQLTIFGQSTTISSSADGVELTGNENGLVIRVGVLAEGTVEYPVNFSDGVYTVAIYDNSAQNFFLGAGTVSLVIAALVFLCIVLTYEQHLTRTIQTLSRQVRQVSQGDLKMSVVPESRDEIGQLALDVDAMRLSIIDKLQREEAAWKANSQLLTAISHDVRTPLTALMGYLEILSDEATTPEERQAYLEICKNNAVRLKGLTDELFGFFLVFGKPTPDQSPEEFDAPTLLDQILTEHEMGLTQKGFSLHSQFGEPICGTIRVDLTHLRRVFDNLFSNVSKYADPNRPVTITQALENGEIRITITNFIPAQATRAESNRIGLQTCHKLVHAMGGEFNQSRTKETFTAEVILPLVDG